MNPKQRTRNKPSLVTRAEEVIPLKAQGWKAF